MNILDMLLGDLLRVKKQNVLTDSVIVASQLGDLKEANRLAAELVKSTASYTNANI